MSMDGAATVSFIRSAEYARFRLASFLLFFFEKRKVASKQTTSQAKKIAKPFLLRHNNKMYFAIKKIVAALPPEIEAHFEKQHRAQQFFSSRLALSSCLEKAGITPPCSLLELEVTDYKNLNGRPDIDISLSHTNDFGAAAMIYKKEYQSVGIDIEKSQRIIKPETQKLFINEHDDPLNLLELWCRKEAAFKALYPLYKAQKVLVLKDIVIQSDQFFLRQNPNVKGEVSLKENKHDLLCALAIIHHQQ